MSAAARIALGLRAQRGGSVAVVVALEDGRPRVVRSAFLATAAEGDRVAFEPYHVAFEMAGGAREDRHRLVPWGAARTEAAALVAEGRARQVEVATKALAGLVRVLAEANAAPAVAALLVNRAGWMTDLLEHALAAPEHPPVMEGLAVREALRAACRQCGLTVVEQDEKALPELASAVLDLTHAGLEARLGELGKTAGKPWRKEQKLACLGAWVAAVGL